MPSWVWIVIVLLLIVAVVGSVVRARGGAEDVRPPARREPSSPDAGEVPAATSPVGAGGIAPMSDWETAAPAGTESGADAGDVGAAIDEGETVDVGEALDEGARPGPTVSAPTTDWEPSDPGPISSGGDAEPETVATEPSSPLDTGTLAATSRRSTSDYGAGSALAAGDGFGPEGWTIKGNIDSMLFHTRESPGFSRMRPAVWFEDEASAEAAGFLRWDHNRRDAHRRDAHRRDDDRRG